MPARYRVTEVARRPYRLTFHATHATYPLTADDAERLIAEYPIVRVTSNRVILRGDDGRLSTIQPGNLGGWSFRWERVR